LTLTLPLPALQVDRPAPDLVHVLQGPLGVGQVQVPAIVVVLQVELTASAIVTILHHDIGLSEVGHADWGRRIGAKCIEVSGSRRPDLGCALIASEQS